MTDTSSKLSAALLDEYNYHSWRPAMESRLRQLGCFRIVTGESQEPSPPMLIAATRDTQGNEEELPQAGQILNGSLLLEYTKLLNAYRDKEEKAAGEILAHMSRSQQTLVKDKLSDAKGIWDALKLVHVQQVPGTRFSAYNELFGIVKGPEETLPAVAARVEDALARVVELCPSSVTTATGVHSYALADLDNELALMAMFRALPREEYGDFVSSLMRQKGLSRRDVEAAFQVEQTKRSAHRGPLFTPSGNSALRTFAKTGPAPQNILLVLLPRLHGS